MNRHIQMGIAIGMMIVGAIIVVYSIIKLIQINMGG